MHQSSQQRTPETYKINLVSDENGTWIVNKAVLWTIFYLYIINYAFGRE